jgi:hypothetical protein
MTENQSMEPALQTEEVEEVSDASSEAWSEDLKPDLPPEILGHILSFLAIAYGDDPDDKPSILAFILTCRAFYGIGLPCLYHQLRLVEPGFGEYQHVPESSSEVIRKAQKMIDADGKPVLCVVFEFLN